MTGLDFVFAIPLVHTSFVHYLSCISGKEYF